MASFTKNSGHKAVILILVSIHLLSAVSAVDTACASDALSQEQRPPQSQGESHDNSVRISPMHLVADADLYAQALQLSWFDTSMTLEADSSTSTGSGPITEMIGEIKELEKEYLEDLKDRRSSYGIYATGEFDHDYLNSESRYSAGLKWKLFNDGYYEALREDAKKILQTQLEFYQLRRDMRDRKLEDDLYALFTYENLVNLNYYQEKVDMLASILERRRQQLEHGYTVQIDVLDIERQLEKSRQNLDFYHQTDFSKFPAEEIRLLNQIENLVLKPQDKLMELTEEQSFDLRIQDNFIERSEFFHEWTDDLTVNMSTLYRKEFQEEDRSILGVEVEVPLFFDRSRESLIDTQKQIYHFQKRAIRYRLHQQLTKLRAFFDFQKNRLLTRQNDIEIVLLKSRRAKTEDSNIIQNLESDPVRKLDLLKINLIDTRYDALMIRLKIYEIILKLASLTQADDMATLFEFD